MPFTNIADSLKIENDPGYTKGILDAINMFYTDVITNSGTKIERWNSGPASKLKKIDARMFTDVPWSLAEDQADPLNDQQFIKAQNYAFVSQKERESILDKFYNVRILVDYRNFDFSSVIGKDTSERPDQDELSKSEKDVVRFISHIRSNQSEESLRAENPDYYRNRMQLLTPQEKFITQLNSEYLTAAKVPLQRMLIAKQGYKEDGSYLEQNETDYKNGIRNYTTEFVTCAERMSVTHQIYSYRMAMVKGENPPELVIKFKVPDRWNPLAVRAFGESIGSLQNPAAQNHFDDYSACANMYDAMFAHFQGPLSKYENDIDQFKNVFIDGASVVDYCREKYPNINFNAYRQEDTTIAIYKATVVSAVLSGEHYVETGIRYMKSDGNMDMKIVPVEPDLTAVAKRENARHSWFRRMFNWGPFKLDNAKRRQARRIAADTAQDKSDRHRDIEAKYRVSKPTTDNPTVIVFDKVEPKKILDEVRGVQKKPYDEWTASLANSKHFLENLTKINNYSNKQGWTVERSIRASIEKIGVGNTINIFTRRDNYIPVADDDTLGSTHKKAYEIYNNIPGNYKPTITKGNAFNAMMNYLFKHGGMENENATMIVGIAQSLAETGEQKKFAESLRVMNEGLAEYEEKLRTVSKLNDKNKNLDSAIVEEFDKCQIQKSINKVLCDTVIKQLSDKQPFDDSILRSADVQKINKLAEDEGKEYKRLLDRVVKEANLDGNRQVSGKAYLQNCYNDIDKIPNNIKDAVQKVVDNNQPAVENHLEPEKKVEKEANVQANKNNANVALA